MQLITDTASIRKIIRENLRDSSIGFVPTMGALHKGHLSLVDASKRNNDKTICSIFVNPTQFNNPEDLQQYPRDMEADYKMLENSGCDYIFAPTVEEIYRSKNPIIKFSFSYLDEVMEGKYRPGHFNGVATIVLKLFNIIEPHRAYFGQKDLQQFVIIKHLVDELNLDVDLQRMPVIREDDGLAMSSRNKRLDPDARQKALIFYDSLKKAAQLLKEGKEIEKVRSEIHENFDHDEMANLEYFEIVNAQNLKPLPTYRTEESVALCIAGYVAGIRLIDNIII